MYGQVFWSATNVTYNSIPFVLLSKIFLFFCDKFYEGKRHLLFQKIHLMYVSRRALWIFQFVLIFILLYLGTQNLLLGTISWQLQTQHFTTFLLLRVLSDLQLDTLVSGVKRFDISSMGKINCWDLFLNITCYMCIKLSSSPEKFCFNLIKFMEYP